MISGNHRPTLASTRDEDFTAEQYRRLCRLARQGWPIADYTHVPWGSRFILWRHDLDFSVNRALALARIEREEGLKATYFVNLHSEFYNPNESGQRLLLKEILSLGHDLGLHFDAVFHCVSDATQLDRLVAQEARYLSDMFGVLPTAFSFHNPSAEHLRYDGDQYGGLKNCYSRRLKTKVAYCSDSNGYWRFRRLRDVLENASDTCLQVLTHPEWWQGISMPPRQRVFRAAYGRAAATMRAYEQGIEQHGRTNHAGLATSLSVFRLAQPRQFELCDYLWNQGAFQTLFVELWRLHESQINRLCKAQLRKVWSIPATEVNAFFAADGVALDGWRLFEALFEAKWQQATGVTEDLHKDWVKVRNQLIHARSSIAPAELEQGCVYLCGVMQKISAWGLSQSFAYDGLAHLGTIGLPTSKTAEGSLEENLAERLDSLPHHLLKRWQDFLSKLSNLT